MSNATTTIAARRTSSRSRTLTYRWLGVIGSGRVTHAQNFDGATVQGVDTFAPHHWQPSGTVADTKTIVRVAVGLLVIDSTKQGRSHEYAAGVTREPVNGDPIDWSRARWISVDDRDTADGTIRVHTVVVDGARGEYVEAVS